MTESELKRPAVVSMSPAKLRWLAIGVAVVALGIYLFIALGGIGKNLVYYWGPTQVEQAGSKAVGATIRLGGMVVPGSIVRGRGASAVEFDVEDGKSTVHVVSQGVPPQLFRAGIGVVVEGTMTKQGVFDGKRLMVSHSNEYRAPEDMQHPDVQKLMSSTTGLGPEEQEAAKEAGKETARP